MVISVHDIELWWTLTVILLAGLLLLLLLSHFSRVRLCGTPQTAAHQAPLSLGFSRQEHWSGLPFPSPMHACMLSHFSHVQLCATPWTAAYQAPVSKGFSRQEYWSGLPFPSPLAGQLCLNLVFHNQIRSWSIYVAKVLSKLELNSEQSHFTDDM